MAQTPMIFRQWRVAWLWHKGRLTERWRRVCAPSRSVGLNRLDGALAMASRNGDFGSIRFLLAQGADPSVLWWLPMRSVASGGDAALLRELIYLSPPPEDAMDDACAYAHMVGREDLLHELATARSRRERVELAACIHDGFLAARAASRRL